MQHWSKLRRRTRGAAHRSRDPRSLSVLVSTLIGKAPESPNRVDRVLRRKGGAKAAQGRRNGRIRMSKAWEPITVGQAVVEGFYKRTQRLIVRFPLSANPLREWSDYVTRGMLTFGDPETPKP